MLYDNTQLARVYLHAWQVTGNEFFRTITEEILDYFAREMLDAEGGSYSTQDADSEGEEGKFFVWTPSEIREVLGNDADAFMAAYGVTRHGNASTGSAHGFEGKNILEFVGDMSQRATLTEARRKLFEAREQRVHPGRDEKVLTSWNGLMLAAFAEAARALNGDDYREVSERNAEFLLRELRQENGRLLRTWKQGEAKLNGYLEDYAYLIEGLLELYQTTFEPRWFVAAQELAEAMIEHYADSDGTLFDTSDDHETLITRPRDPQDNATPSGNAMAVTTLLKLAGFTNDLRYVDIAHQALAQMQTPTGGGMMSQYPLGFGQWLQALAYALSKPREVAIIGDPESANTSLAEHRSRDLPALPGRGPGSARPWHDCTSPSESWPGGRTGCSLRLRRLLSGARIRLPAAGYGASKAASAADAAVILYGHALPVGRGFEVRETDATRRELENREGLFCWPCLNAEQMKGKMDGHA